MEDLRGAFIGDAVVLPSALGPLELGIVDPHHPGVAEAVSRLLFRSIQDARETRGGHLPEWLVEDIQNNYISPEKVLGAKLELAARIRTDRRQMRCE